NSCRVTTSVNGSPSLEDQLVATIDANFRILRQFQLFRAVVRPNRSVNRKFFTTLDSNINRSLCYYRSNSVNQVDELLDRTFCNVATDVLDIVSTDDLTSARTGYMLIFESDDNLVTVVSSRDQHFLRDVVTWH